MKDNEQSLGRGSEQRISTARRSSIILALLAGTALLVAACSTETPKNPTVPTAVASVGGNHWWDPELPISNDRLLKSVELYLDPSYSGGSLAMRVCFNDAANEVRITSRQLNLDRPGYLFNRPFDIAQPCRVFYPVTGVNPDENDQVNVGARTFDEPYDNTYTGVAYSVTRQGNTPNIAVQSLGEQTLNPDSITPRDPATAKDYFKR